MKRKPTSAGVRIVVLSLLIVGVAFALRLQLQRITLARSGGSSQFTTRVGDQLPSFEVTDLAGKVWRSSDLKGKVVYVNVWASW
jgi:hypothetical protein